MPSLHSNSLNRRYVNSITNFQAVFSGLTRGDARPTLWRGRPTRAWDGTDAVPPIN
jgi:hypothetical protein